MFCSSRLFSVAATVSVLEGLAGESTLCLAETHGTELTRIPAKRYDNRHFSETVREEGMHFDFLLKPGPTRTRNAIRLLSQMGYPEKVIAQANKRAGHFEDEGIWK